MGAYLSVLQVLRSPELSVQLIAEALVQSEVISLWHFDASRMQKFWWMISLLWKMPGELILLDP